MGDLHDRNGDNVVSGPIGYFSTEYECLEAMLLTYGPGRVFPPFVALVETVRGFAMAFERHMLHSRKVANESLQRTGDEGRAIREANAVIARQAEGSKKTVHDGADPPPKALWPGQMKRALVCKNPQFVAKLHTLRTQ